MNGRGVSVFVGDMFGLGGGRGSGVKFRNPGRCGGFRGGRASLDPGPVPQVELRHVRMNCWNAASLSAGTSSDFTWLSLFVQSAKQKPWMNHRGHILHSPFQSTLSLKPLLAKWVAHVSPVWSLHESGWEGLSTFELLRFFFFPLVLSSSLSSAERFFEFVPPFPVLESDAAVASMKVEGSWTKKVPKRTFSISWVKLSIESSTWVRQVSDMHSSSQSWKRVSTANKNWLMNFLSASRVFSM